MSALTPTSPVTAVAATAVESEHVLEVSTTKVTLHNTGPNTVYMRNATGVTDANGFPLLINERISLGKTSAAALSLWLICTAAESAGVRIIEEQ